MYLGQVENVLSQYAVDTADVEGFIFALIHHFEVVEADIERVRPRHRVVVLHYAQSLHNAPLPLHVVLQVLLPFGGHGRY